jgi:maltooligosyltrehalose trehalohydrolase
MSINVSKRGIGVSFNSNSIAEVIVWAPEANSIKLITADTQRALKKEKYGYWKCETDIIRRGSPYKFRINDKEAFPDPASLSQAEGVHGNSYAVDTRAFEWTDIEWKNVPLREYIIYELHTGTFSNTNNFQGIKERLGYLRDLGITAIEIMPVGQFPGKRNWGYDGVYPFAVQHSYGGAAGLQDLVNTCHENNIAVILDVIYNHLGPEGNYLPQYGPYFTEKYKTPWGLALNYDDAWCNGVRDYVTENVLMWFRDFHIDALRLDAVHAIKDLSSVHLLKSIRQKVNELSTITGKPHYLIAELDLNDPLFINPPEKGGYGIDAQWIDEFHHALRVASGQKREGYYSDFNGIADLAKSYRDAYVYDGQFSEHRKKFFGVKTRNEGHQFVVFSQNHDHIGNRMLGERTSTLLSFEMCKLIAAAVMVSPFLPMLFMGEEWGETNPFLYFIDHTDKQLAEMVNKGRKEEFASFNWQGETPDPRTEETFARSMLQWDLAGEQRHQVMLAYYKQLIRLRKTQPALRSTDRAGTSVQVFEENKQLILHRKHSEQHLLCVMNFSQQEQQIKTDMKGCRELFNSSSQEWNGPTRKLADKNDMIQPESIIIFERN